MAYVERIQTRSNAHRTLPRRVAGPQRMELHRQRLVRFGDVLQY